MNGFRFSLQNVLDWRRCELELEEAKLRRQAAAIAELDRARAELESEGIAAELSVRERNPVAGSELVALAGFRMGVRLKEQRIAAQRAAREQDLARQRQTMLEARRRYRLLERLRDRRWEEWRAAASRELENFASESYLAQWTRRGGSP
jgi:hypothetical protein